MPKDLAAQIRYGGKDKQLVLGAYPDMTITAARAGREAAKAHFREGHDPTLEARRARLVNESLATETFEKFARAWYEAQRLRWKPVHADDVITSTERDLFPTLGP